MRFHVALFASASLLAACGGSGDSSVDLLDREPQLGQEFVLGYGASTQVQDLILKFSAVSEDSRCPINGVCAQEGNAKILLSAMRGSSVAVIELNTHPDERSLAYFSGYVIMLRDLHPYPFAPLQTHLPTYKATLVVDGHAIPAG